jgi:hypothetical protein
MTKFALLKNNLIICPYCGCKYKNTLSNKTKSKIKTNCKKCLKDFHIENQTGNKKSTSNANSSDEEKCFHSFLKMLSNQKLSDFLEMRELIYNHKDYSPYNLNVEKIEKFYLDEKYQEVFELYGQDWPNLLLSPRVHMILSNISKMINDKQKTEFHQAAAYIIVDLITKSGDGSAELPYKVLRISDEYDVLSALQEEKESQKLFLDEGRAYDVINTLSGKMIYFDITEAHRGQSE